MVRDIIKKQQEELQQKLTERYIPRDKIKAVDHSYGNGGFKCSISYPSES
jgi:hypothetical protein